MKNLTNTQGSVWLAILVIIAVVVAALLLSGNSNLLIGDDDQSIHGLVSDVNQERQQFLLTEIEVLSVAEDGSAESRKTEYVVAWTGDKEITPHHPSLLEGGEMVRLTPSEELEDGQLVILDPETLEITRGPNLEAEPESSDETSTTSTTTNN